MNVDRQPAPYGVTIYSDVGILTFDATVREVHQGTAEPTRHPVEEGVDISDHVLLRPKGLTLTNVQSLTPMDEEFQERDRDRKSYDLLERIRAERQPVTVVTHLTDYDDMVLVDMSHPLGADTGKSVVSTLRFEEIITVTSQMTDVPPELIEEVLRSDAAAEETAGAQDPPADATDEVADESNGRSFLLGIAEDAGVVEDRNRSTQSATRTPPAGGNAAMTGMLNP